MRNVRTMSHRLRLALAVPAHIGLFCAVGVVDPALSPSSRVLAGEILAAQNNPADPSSFSLDFGPEMGGISSATITSTEYLLRIDAQGGTARFVNYYQQVEPLTLPGGISTGNIVVQIVPGSSTGTFDPATGEFTTSEQYEIHFGADLSLFGLVSPVTLPSASVGVVDSTGSPATIEMIWDGVGQLANPADPANPITFTYQCRVNTLYNQNPGAGDLNCNGTSDSEDIDGFVMALLDPALYDTQFPGCDRQKADVDADGAVTNKDIDAFVGLIVN